jgi:hypothetical protein
MKKIFLTTGLILALGLGTYARVTIAEGKTNSALGDYKIEVADQHFMVNGKVHIPYVITYANSDLEVRVAIDMDRKGKKYYVLSDNLSVQYVSNKKYFGVERLDKELEINGYTTSDAALNRAEYFHQKFITTGQNWKKDNTELIAAYFPLLLENADKMVAAK